MKDGKKAYRTVDEYIRLFPAETRKTLRRLREAILSAAPGAEESISYGMPAFRLGGILVYFAAYENHIGFYPTSAGVAAFAGELSRYECSKGTVRFPIDEPLPYPLIKKMVKFRAAQNLGKERGKSRKKN